MSLDGIYFKLFPIEYCEFRIEKQLGNSRSRHTGGFFLSRIFSSTLTVLLFVSGGEELNMFPHRPPQSTQLSADGRFALWHIILTANSFHGCELFCLNNLLHWHKQDRSWPVNGLLYFRETNFVLMLLPGLLLLAGTTVSLCWRHLPAQTWWVYKALAFCLGLAQKIPLTGPLGIWDHQAICHTMPIEVGQR